MKELATALATLTGTRATAERLSDFYKWDWEDNHRWLIHMGEEFALFIFPVKGKIRISACYRVGKTLPTLTASLPSITCTASRGPEAIAKDIARRILPAVPEWLEEAKKEYAQQREYESRANEVREFVRTHRYHGNLRMEPNGGKVHVSGYLTIEQAKKLLEI